MAKQTITQSAPFSTINTTFSQAKEHYNEAWTLEENNGDQKQIDNRYCLAAFGFWMALVQGHSEAAYCLHICFKDGLGVKQDTTIATIFFKIAQGLKDQKCESNDDHMQISSSTQKVVDNVIQLIQKAQKDIDPDGKWDWLKLAEQFKLFDEQFIGLSYLPDKQTLTSLFYAGELASEIPQAQEINYTTDYDTNYDTSHDNSIVLTGHSDDSSCCCVLC